MNGYIQQIEKIIKEEDKLILVLVIAEGCMHRETSLEVFLKKHIQSCNVPMRVLRFCFDEEHMPFPRPMTETIYYFGPKSTKPLFLRTGPAATERFLQDVEVATKMINGIRYVDAVFEKEEDKKLIEKTEELLKSDDTKSKYPTTSKMLKGFAKDMWESAKYAGKGLPILVNSDMSSERYSICEQCPNLTEEARCTECGCFMKKKVNLAASSCPIGKWDSVQQVIFI